ncbi:MAG: carbohydrate-binding protein [Planctomycetaceae bacterium]
MVPVLAGNARPEIQFRSPQTGDFFDASHPIHYEIIVADAEDGTNDEDAYESGLAEVIDRESPGRVVLNAQHSPDSFSGGVSGGSGSGIDPPGLKRMKGSDCFNCHAVDQKRVGPQLIDIANKYRDKTDALEASVQRVMKGSTGVWGKIPMIPHGHHSTEEIREMVGWIYSLQPSGLVRVFEGFVGEVPVPAEDAAKPGYYRLDVSYTDRGTGVVPALNASATVHLRSRTVEAEDADEVNGPQLLGSGNASSKRFVGAINHGHSLRFRAINFDQVGDVILKIASAGSGGAIELRTDTADGPLLATVDVEVNGQWENFYERRVQLPPVTGHHDLFVVFTHPAKAGGLMNLDALIFPAP